MMNESERMGIKIRHWFGLDCRIRIVRRFAYSHDILHVLD